MRTHRRSRPTGFILAACLMVCTLVGMLLAVNSAYESLVARGADTAGRSIEVRAIARSAVAELALGFSRLANRPGNALYASLRSVAPGGLLAAGRTGLLPLPAAALAEIQAADHLRRTRALADELERSAGGMRCTIETAVEVDVTRGMTVLAPCELAGAVSFVATVTLEGAGRSIVRRARCLQGMRVSRLALPWPFDSMGFFVHHPDLRPLGVGSGAPPGGHELVARVGASLAHLRTRLATSGAWRRVTPELLGRFEELSRCAGRSARATDWSGASFYLSLERDTVPDLARLAPDASMRSASSRLLDSVGRIDTLVGSATNLPPSPEEERTLSDAIGACIDAIERYQVITRQYFDQFIKVGHDAPEHRAAFDPGILALSRDDHWRRLAWYEMDSPFDFAHLIPPRDGPEPAASGIVILRPGNAPRSFDGAHGPVSPEVGRLVVIAPGDVHLGGADDAIRCGGGHGRLTVLARGRIEIAPGASVTANLAALSGLTIGDGASLEGNVFVDRGPVRIGTNVRWRRDPTTARPDPFASPRGDLYRVAFDPYQVCHDAP